MTAATHPLPSAALAAPSPPACAAPDRVLRARLDLVAASLPFSIYANPVWAAFTAITAFGGFFPRIGHLLPAQIGAIVAFHLVNSVYGAVLMRIWRRKRVATRTMHWHLVALQATISLAWAMGVWLTWIDHNAVNNVFEALLLAIVLWGVTLMRASDTAIYCAGLVPVLSVFIIRAALVADHLNIAFLVLGPVCGLYAVASGHAARKRIDELLHTRFANEDLAVELSASRDEAVRRRQEAEAANASKTAFVANMSHELRTPLNAILGFSELIETEAIGPGVGEAYRAYAGHIHESGAHLLSIINDILDVAKIDAGKMELCLDIFDPRAAIEAAVTLLHGKIEEKSQTLRVAIDPAIAEITADARAFKQILVNLLSNAAKFTPQGGRIEIRGAVGPERTFLLEIVDSGPGVPPEQIPAILEPFNRIDNRYDSEGGGTGLGLTLVRALMGLHGGCLALRNNEGGGLAVSATFAPRSAVLASRQPAA